MEQQQQQAQQQLALGVSLALGTTFLSALGLVCKKRAHDDPAHAGQRSCRRPAWLLGLACLVVSALASLGVSHLLGQQLASCMAAVTLVWSLLLRRALLGEALQRLDYAVGALLLAGVLTILLAAPASAAPPPPPAAAADAADPRLMYAVALAAPGAQAALACAGAAALALAVAAHAACAAARLPRPARPLLLLLLSALFSAATGVFSKALGAHLALAARGSAPARAAFAAATLWLSLLGLLAAVAAQLWHLNAALKCAPAALVLPAYQGLFVLAGVGAGALVWGEGAGRSPVASGALAAGLLCMLAGLLLLVVGRGGFGAAAAAAAAAAAPVDPTALALDAAALASHAPPLLPLPPRQPRQRKGGAAAAAAGGRAASAPLPRARAPLRAAPATASAEL